MKMTTRIIGIAVLGLTACSGSSGDQQTNDQQPAALVTLATAQRGGVASTLTVYGAVEQNADTQYTLVAPVEAVVTRIAAPAGSPVGRGDLVIALSPSPDTRSQIAQLSAEAQNAQSAFERAQRLRADGLVSDAEVESARSAAESAKARRAAMSMQTGQLSLRAPGSGYVQTIASSPGDLVSSGATLATISRNGNLRARFGIDPALIPRLSRADGLRLDPADGSAATSLPIVSVDPSADLQTRLASLYVNVPASAGSGVGQPLRGVVTLEQAARAVTVPYAALLDDGGQPFVFTVTDSTAQRHDVAVGASDGTTAAITSGISAGDQVVVDGGTALEDGMKVRTQ